MAPPVSCQSRAPPSLLGGCRSVQRPALRGRRASLGGATAVRCIAAPNGQTSGTPANAPGQQLARPGQALSSPSVPAHSAPSPTRRQHPAAAPTKPWVWLQQWYPAGVAADLPPDRPHAITLFGRQFVLWFDRVEQRWCCFEDRCPHRLAPLSEGRIDAAGRLQCSYHGWGFEGSGRCADVPQASSASSNSRACTQPRACATALPTTQSLGLIWVWPDASPGAQDKAAATALPIPAELEAGVAALAGRSTAGVTLPAGEGGADVAMSYVDQGGGWMVRELPYGFLTLVENILDPAHVPFAHHGTVAGKREDAQPFRVTLKDRIAQEGFTATCSPSTRTLAGQTFEMRFLPPAGIMNKIETASGMSFFLFGYCVPTSPGRSLLVRTSFSLQPAQGGATAALRTLLHRAKPRWMFHHTLLDILDTDNVLLHHQERNLERAGNDWRAAYYMPTSTDTAVVAFQRWFHDLAGGPANVPWAQDSASVAGPEPSRRELMDRLHAHTERCPACSAALRTLRMTRTAGLAAAIAATVAAAWLPGAAMPAAAVGVVGVVAAAGAHWAEPSFVFKHHSHAEQD